MICHNQAFRHAQKKRNLRPREPMSLPLEPDIPVGEVGLKPVLSMRGQRDADVLPPSGLTVSLSRLLDSRAASTDLVSLQLTREPWSWTLLRFSKGSSFSSFSKISDAFHVLFYPLANHLEGLSLRFGSDLR